MLCKVRDCTVGTRSWASSAAWRSGREGPACPLASNAFVQLTQSSVNLHAGASDAGRGDAAAGPPGAQPGERLDPLAARLGRLLGTAVSGRTECARSQATVGARLTHGVAGCHTVAAGAKGTETPAGPSSAPKGEGLLRPGTQLGRLFCFSGSGSGPGKPFRKRYERGLLGLLLLGPLLLGLRSWAGCGPQWSAGVPSYEQSERAADA